MSGLAVFAFVFSLIAILASVAAWWVPIFPIALAILALVKAPADRRRGRALAVWAIVIALCTGSCAYVMHSGVRTLALTVSGSVLSALASDASDAEKDEVLAPWMHAPTLETDLRARIRARYTRVQDTYGKYIHPPVVGGFFSGLPDLMVPPEDIEEIGRTDQEPPPKPMQCFWVRANFEKGQVVVSLELVGGEVSDLKSIQDELKTGAPAPLVSDVRFYKMKGP